MAGHREYGRAVPETGDFDRRRALVSAELERLVLRLTRLSARSWRDCRPAVVALVAALVDVAGRQQGRTLAVPALDDHVLASAVAVIGRDLLGSIDDADLLAAAASAIETALAATR